MLTLADIRAAAARLDGVAHRTPVITSTTLDAITGARVHLKAENLQRMGAFKFRGAYNCLAAMDPMVRARGVVSYSSGNHAQAVALAARLHNTAATIVMPTDAPAAKLAATRGYGAKVVSYDRHHLQRETVAAQIAAKLGASIVPPYDHYDVMAGQGTVALELLDTAGELDVLLVCVSGGGLIAGCATAAKALLPHIRVIGVEPADGDDTRRSLQAGHRVSVPAPATIADGLRCTTPGELTFEINRLLVDDIVTVTDDDLLHAMAFLYDRTKLVVEPSGAAGVAALLSGAVDVTGLRVGVTLSGGNVDFAAACGWAGDRPRPDYPPGV